MKKVKHDTAIVIPTYNERENVLAICEAVLAQMDARIWIVDDDSPDGTGDLADELASKESRVRVLHRRGRPRGLGPAYRDGFVQALSEDVDFVMQMDADFSHDPAMVPVLRQAAEEADLVLGSRYVEGGGTQDWSLLRRFISQGGSTYARLILGMPIKDVTGGFKCWRASALRDLHPERVASTGFAFQIEMNHLALKSGMRVVEHPILFADRLRGDSKMSFGIFLEGLLAVWRIRYRHGRR